jgi:hypothetical protein
MSRPGRSSIGADVDSIESLAISRLQRHTHQSAFRLSVMLHGSTRLEMSVKV